MRGKEEDKLISYNIYFIRERESEGEGEVRGVVVGERKE